MENEDLNFSKFNTSESIIDHFDNNTKCKSVKFNIMKDFKFQIDDRYSLLFEIISNTSYSNYMIKTSAYLYDECLVSGYLTTEDILSLQSDLEDYSLFNKYTSIRNSYILLPYKGYDGILYIDKADMESDCIITFKRTDVLGFKEATQYSFNLNNQLLSSFIDMMYDISLCLPYF